MHIHSAGIKLQTCHWGRCSVGQVTTWVPVPQPPGARLLILQGPFSTGSLLCRLFIL